MWTGREKRSGREKRGCFGAGYKVSFHLLSFFRSAKASAGRRTSGEPGLLPRFVHSRPAYCSCLAAWGIKLRCGLGLAPARVGISAFFFSPTSPLGPRLDPWNQRTPSSLVTPPSSPWRFRGSAVASPPPAGISANRPKSLSTPILRAADLASDPCSSGAPAPNPGPHPGPARHGAG